MQEIHLTGAQLGGLSITNTLLTSMLVVVVVVILAHLATRKMSLVPGTWQNIVELIVEYLYNLVESVTGDIKRTRLFFPWVASFFLFIIAANYIGLMPGVGSIGFYIDGSFVPLLRSPASDLNTTLGLALVSVFLAHYYSVHLMGWSGYLGVWFSPNPILLFAGVLELFLEIAKIASLSFRLFGNIFAGETVLEVMSSMFSPFVVTLPFLGLEVIVGFVQGLVFAMLTLTSMIILTTDHSDHAHS